MFKKKKNKTIKILDMIKNYNFVYYCKYLFSKNVYYYYFISNLIIYSIPKIQHFDHIFLSDIYLLEDI
jgi:hypothetical protein